MGVADEKLQPLLPSDAPTDLLVLARICCDYDPDMRPSFGELVPQLEAAVAEMRVSAWSLAVQWCFLASTDAVPSAYAWTCEL